MAIDVADRKDNPDTGTFTLYVCPNWSRGRCHCERDADDNPSPGHAAYHYPQDPPENMPAMVELGRDVWQERAREHAIAAETVARGGAVTAAANLGAEDQERRAAAAAAVQTSAQTDGSGDASDR